LGLGEKTGTEKREKYKGGWDRKHQKKKAGKIWGGINGYPDGFGGGKKVTPLSGTPKGRNSEKKTLWTRTRQR